MSKLEELIEKLCPNGVEYYPLNSIFNNFNGMTGVSNKWREEGNCQFIEYMNAYRNLKIKVDQLPFATVKKLEQNCLRKGDILLTSASETPDECALSSVIEDEIQDNIFLDDHLFGIRLKENYSETINTTFINYYMHTKTFRKFVNKTVRGVTRFYISVADFMKICIPVPPLEVQCEIVHILDNFTLFSAELSAELKARQKQYEYYRNELLYIKGETKLLGKVANFGTGSKPKNIIEENNGNLYEYINAGTTNSGYVKDINRKRDAVTTPSRGQGGIGFVGYQENDFWLGPLCYAIYSNDEKILNNKYLYYELTSKKDEIMKRKNTGGVPSLNGCDLKTIPLNIPPIEEQVRIVNILDKFYKICTDITEGLPAEIEARQKQYEYYRDKLLTFKELKINE